MHDAAKILKGATLASIDGYGPPAHFTMRYHDGPVSHEVCASIPQARVGDLLLYIHSLIDEEVAKSTEVQRAFVEGFAGNG